MKAAVLKTIARERVPHGDFRVGEMEELEITIDRRAVGTRR